MKTLLITLILSLTQSPVVIVKNNGDQLDLSNVVIFQNEARGSSNSISYSYRGEKINISFQEIKRISFKETLRRKKGITTYRVILVKSDNNKLEVELDLVKLEGIAGSGKKQSMNFSSVDKISF